MGACISLCQKKEEEDEDVKEENSDENDDNYIDNPVAKKIGRTKKNKTRIPKNVVVDDDDDDDDEEPYHTKKSKENVNIIKINEKEGKKENNKGKEDED